MNYEDLSDEDKFEKAYDFPLSAETTPDNIDPINYDLLKFSKTHTS